MLERFVIGAATTALTLGAVAPDAKAWAHDPYDGEYTVSCEEDDVSYIELDTLKFNTEPRTVTFGDTTITLTDFDFLEVLKAETNQDRIRVDVSCDGPNGTLSLAPKDREELEQAVKNSCNIGGPKVVAAIDDLPLFSLKVVGEYCDSAGDVLSHVDEHGMLRGTAEFGESLPAFEPADPDSLAAGALLDGQGNVQLNADGNAVEVSEYHDYLVDEEGQFVFGPDGDLIPRELCGCQDFAEDFGSLVVSRFEAEVAKAVVPIAEYKVDWRRGFWDNFFGWSAWTSIETKPVVGEPYADNRKLRVGTGAKKDIGGKETLIGPGLGPEQQFPPLCGYSIVDNDQRDYSHVTSTNRVDGVHSYRHAIHCEWPDPKTPMSLDVGIRLRHEYTAVR